MSDDIADHPVMQFLVGLLTGGMVLFPALTSIVSLGDVQIAASQVLLGAATLAIPVAFEVVVSNRDLERLGRYALAVAVLWFLSGFAEFGIYSALGNPGTIPAVRVTLVTGAYAVAYLLVYKGVWAEFRAAVGR